MNAMAPWSVSHLLERKHLDSTILSIVPIWEAPASLSCYSLVDEDVGNVEYLHFPSQRPS